MPDFGILTLPLLGAVGVFVFSLLTGNDLTIDRIKVLSGVDTESHNEVILTRQLIDEMRSINESAEADLIGIDVGGTNTDAVVMQHRDVRAVVKVPTTRDVTGGLMQALGQVLEAAALAPEQVGLVVIGTTHFTNAVIERRHLAKTAVVRLCLPANQCLPPMVDWPEDLRATVGEQRHVDAGAVAGHRLVDRVVDDFPHEGVQPGRAGRSDVHAGTLANGVESLEHLDVLGGVVAAGGSSHGANRR